MLKILRKWKKEYLLRCQYGVPERLPFFDLAGKYLPQDKNALVVDVGAGDGLFAKHLGLRERFSNHRLLDSNKESVSMLKDSLFHSQYYCAPGTLPFSDASVSFVHLSHIVEHLSHEDLYHFLKEIDRVLLPTGVLVISTPLLWDRFYDDLSHIKPYNPITFINYLTRRKNNATQSTVSEKYTVKELVYRYRSVSEFEWGSRYYAVDAIMRSLRVLRSFLGFRRYIKNGYTIVLQKLA